MFNKKDKKEEESKKDKKDKKTKKEDKKDPGKKQNSSASASEDEPTPTTTNPSPRPPGATGQPTTSPVDTQAAKKVEDEKKAEEEKKKAEAEKKRKEEEEKAKAAVAASSANVEDKKEKKSDKSKEHKKSDKPSERVSDENIDAEVHSLESVKLDANENPQSYKDQFNLLSKDVYVAFDKLQNFARDLNTQIPVPEFVVVGKKGHGKSSIIESFFGEQVNAVGSGGVTKRPFYLSLINNLSCETPRITLKRDPAIREFDHDVEVKLGEVSSEVAKRLKVASEEPVILQYESKSVCNLTFIDTPGLLEEDEGEVSKEERETSVLNLAKPSHRYIIAVEASREWSRMELVNTIKKVDPELTRTTFVYSKFYTHLQSFTSTREVNKFLGGTLPDVKTFFTTVPSEGVRSKFNEADKYQQKIWQTYKRDVNGLEQLQFDKRFENNVGVLQFRRYVLGLAWKNYQESIPKILKQLRAKKVETEKAILEAERDLKSLDSSKLRSIASQYVVNFLQIVERLIAGTSEGNPLVNGQTLEEEKSAHGDGDWVDSYNRTIRFEPEEWSIPYWNNKLYGGQQFERLLAEYKAVSDHTEISEVTMDDVATAAGINKLNNIPNYMWAASDLAQQKSQDAFGPLIEQLTNRAIFIMKRLTDIAEKILESRRKKWTGPGNPVDDIDRYPYFTYHVKDLFNKYVENTARVCKEKCMDEFYSTRTILWDFTEFADKSLPLERNDQEDTRTSVVQLATELFNSLRDRITKNVLLKLYNFFLVPMQTELWNEIQGKVNSLSDGALEQIFEVTSTKDKLKNKISHLQEELAKGAEQDKLFMEYAATFSHPLASLDKKQATAK